MIRPAPLRAVSRGVRRGMAKTRRKQPLHRPSRHPGEREGALISEPPRGLDSPGAARAARLQAHSLAVAVILILAAWAYGPALRGDFVYDDQAQIAQNPLIQQDALLWQALSSDVWAFQGMQKDRPRNYWRPVFVAALAAQYRLFGLQPRGWHAVSLGFHVAASVLAYLVLVRLTLRWDLAVAVAWLFAVHPAHIQSVAWVSGLPDPLAATFTLGAYASYLQQRSHNLRLWRGMALVLFVLALLSKESSIALVGIVAATEWVLGRDASFQPRMRATLRATLPFLLVACGFVGARLVVLGAFRSLSPEAPGLTTVVLTLPSLLFFYGGQLLWPARLGPVHGVRYASFSALWTPLGFGGLLVAGWLLFRLQRGRPLAGIGLAWLLLPLLPVLDTRVFQPELIAQDRYLYLPVLGALTFLAACLGARLPAWSARGALAVALGASLLLAHATRGQSAHWANGLALWEHAVKIDPSSAIAWSQLGDEYQSLGRLPEGRQAFERSLAIEPDFTAAQVGLGIVAGKQGRWAEVEQQLRPVLARLPDHETAVEQLGQAYQQQRQYEKAIAVFEAATHTIPKKRDVYGVNIAVLTAQAGRLPEATQQLETLVPRVDERAEPGLLKAWWYLAELYRVQGLTVQARTAYQRYLALSASSPDQHVQKLRGLALGSLQGLEKP